MTKVGYFYLGFCGFGYEVEVWGWERGEIVRIF
jgi:hypothetical protein